MITDISKSGSPYDQEKWLAKLSAFSIPESLVNADILTSSPLNGLAQAVKTTKAAMLRSETKDTRLEKTNVDSMVEYLLLLVKADTRGIRGQQLPLTTLPILVLMMPRNL